MKDSARLTIGFMIHHLDNDYSKALLKGAITAAEECNVNLVIFPGRSLNCQLDDSLHTTFEYQYNTVYSYADKESLDALIISAGTVGQFIPNEEFKAFLDSFENLPIITAENKVRGYPCVRLSGSGIKNVIRHLVKEHGKKNIAFVSGPKGNADAEERLAFYKEALEENELEFNPEMVAYGKFSEYCSDIVGNLIDRNNGKIDAICFANDMMCKGGYKAIKERGLEIGKDIAITGYDDSEVATSLSPMLTTVRADAGKLGACVLREAIKLVKCGGAEDMLSLSSSPVFRQSCGCTPLLNNSTAIIEQIANSYPAEQLTDMIVYGLIQETNTHLNSVAVIDEFKSLVSFTINSLKSKNPAPHSAFYEKVDAVIEKGILDYISPDDMIDIIKQVRNVALAICGDDVKRALGVHEVSEYFNEAIISNTISEHYDEMNDITFTNFLINNITKDMTISGGDEEKSYFSIVNNLYRIHMDSCYIYAFDEPVIHTNRMEWIKPPVMSLKAFHDGERISAVAAESQKMSSSDYFCNKFTPERRRTAIVFPLFMNEEQYGVILYETSFKYFPYVYSITPQICSSIKLVKLLNKLECSLDAAQYRNTMLNRISMYDELTGVYNRRGFYEFTNRLLAAPENDGKHAVLIFADLDNLKIINDNFGHDDGDYAITTGAGFLKSGLRNTDIVARIGGDEFVAFAICEDKEIIQSIPSRIKKIAAEHNKVSDKPYNITISVGLYELTCGSNINIQFFMDKADASLYEDKKNKNPNIFKS